MENKFSTIFSSSIKPLVSEEKDKFLALASLVDVGNFIPNIDTDKNVDLLPMAFNACVANRVNKNGDVIDTATAIEIYKHFINKPINIEHNRKNLIGVILTAGFSEFGTDSPLTEEQVKDKTEPFNITLGGVLWRIVNQSLTDLVEDSNDETSENYKKISASWELGFNEFDLIIMEGNNKNLNDSYTLPENEKNEMLKYLKSYGGSGKVAENRFIYRKVKGGVVPLGIGLTENPAADVSGVSVKKQKNEEKVSLSSEKNVVTINKELMKINSIEDIKDEVMKEITASAVRDFVQQELDKASQNYVSLKNEKENAMKQANEKIESISTENAKISEDLKKLQAEVDAFKAAEDHRQKQETFNTRMAALEQEFEFDAELRAEIAKEIQDLSEESFSAYRGKMKKMAKGLTKKQEKLPDFIKEKIEEKEKKEGKPEDKKEAKEMKASEDTAASVIEEIIDSKNEKVEVPNTISVRNASMYQKYKSAFDVDQFVINK